MADDGSVTSSPFPTGYLSGTGSEIGQAHGEHFRGEISESIELYQEWFSETAGIEWSQALEYATRFVPVISEYDKSLMEEIAGIATGSNQPVEAITALNCRTEIGYGMGEKNPGGLSSNECTALGIPGRASVSGHSFIAQNWDWQCTHLGITVLLQISKEGCPDLVTLTEAGMVGKIGMNSAGLGLCFTLLATDKYQMGLPVHVLARSALEKRTLGEAFQAVTGTTRAGAGDFLFGYVDSHVDQDNGEIVNMEWTPLDYHLTFADTSVVHTNHFNGQMYGTRDSVKLDTEGIISTFIRQHRGEHILGKYDGNFGREAIEAVLSDHYNYPNSICSHPDRSNDNLGQSNASIIIDLDAQVLSCTSGPPCESEYLDVSLN